MACRKKDVDAANCELNIDILLINSLTTLNNDEHSPVSYPSTLEYRAN